ncbi:MAG: hypothetical protein AAF466_02375 [Bacteroidota bacterium]
MKNRKNIKILLPAVVIIWGVVLYQVVSAMFPDEGPQLTMANPTFKAPKQQTKDTFSLQPIDRDPFLGTWKPNRTQGGTRGKSKSTSQEQSWPEISYQGSITDKQGRSGIFMVTIDGVQHLLKKGEQAAQITVRNGSATQVTLAMKGRSRKFEIQ